MADDDQERNDEHQPRTDVAGSAEAVGSLAVSESTIEERIAAATDGLRRILARLESDESIPDRDNLIAKTRKGIVDHEHWVRHEADVENQSLATTRSEAIARVVDFTAENHGRSHAYALKIDYQNGVPHLTRVSERSTELTQNVVDIVESEVASLLGAEIPDISEFEVFNMTSDTLIRMAHLQGDAGVQLIVKRTFKNGPGIDRTPDEYVQSSEELFVAKPGTDLRPQTRT